MTRSLTAALALTFLASTAFAQTPADRWRTVTTPHFRVHYPAPYEPWALRAASRLESIRDDIIAETEFAPAESTDILVEDPVAQANGATIPLLDTPRIVLFAEPPGPDSTIGDYSDWIDLLVVHEMTHMIHLGRPSRNPLERAFEKILPVGPIALNAPRWVTEGYATVVEGRLTGSGRPSSTLRAAILRKWAESGQLPTYAQLQSDQRFLGMSMAYLAGSAYLQWLEDRSGAGSLRKLWPRMSARKRRSFDEAFEGVFGDSPQRLYGQFTAELTERAVTVDRESRGEMREGELWQETEYGSGDPDVSPDGRSLAVVIRSRSKPPRLVILSAGPEIEDEKKYEERLKMILARDPQDVAPVRRKPLPRKALHTLVLPDGGDIDTPRWTPGGRSILFSHRVPDRDGNLHHDLYRWSPGSDGVERLTVLADVSDADPLPNGTEAVAVRTRDGFSQLVLVDLASGAVRALAEPSLDRVIAHPRVSHDGKRVAFTAHSGGTWHLVVRDLASGAERTFDTPPRANVATPEWSRTTDDIFAVVMSGGYIDINRFAPDGSVAPVTRMSGGAFGPAPSSDGRLFFMALEPEGYTVRVLSAVAPAPPRQPFSRSLVPALPPPPTRPAVFAAQTVSGPRPYGIGRQEPNWLLHANDTPSARTVEAGIRFGDVVGRLDTIAVAAFGSAHSQRGATLATAWRGWPVEVAAQIYRMRERDSHQDGIELRTSWDAHSPLNLIAIDGGVLGSRISSRARNLGFASASWLGREQFGDMRVDGGALLAGEAGDAPHARAIGRGGVSFGRIRLGAQLEADRAGGSEPMTVGGLATTIVPRSAIANRVLDPALATATLAGKRYTGGRVEASFSGVTFFYREHKLGQRLSLAGVEVARSIPPIPLVKTPGMALTVGAARILDEPLRDRTRWWIGIRMEP